MVVNERRREQKGWASKDKRPNSKQLSDVLTDVTTQATDEVGFPMRWSKGLLSSIPVSHSGTKKSGLKIAQVNTYHICK